MKKALVALVAGALMVLPTTAHATTVGGQSASAGPCDVTLLSVTVNPSTGEVSFDVGGADCDVSEVRDQINRILSQLITCHPDFCP